ncbi:MAG: rane protein [Hyphomicrobiales bacterium]|nr:rane protein [Hyphomicrobiales bacterium]
MSMSSGNPDLPGASPNLQRPPSGEMSSALAAHWWTLVLRGVIAILFGVIAFVSPGAAMLSLALLFAVYLIVDGLIGIFAAFRASHADNRWWLLLAEAVLSLLMGVLAFMFPGGAVLAFVVVTAIWALMSGGFLLAAAFRFSPGRTWLAIGGIVSILYGALLIATPLVGAGVLTWWLGAYAMLFGIMLIAAGLKLRSAHA